MPFAYSVHEEHEFLWKRVFGDVTKDDIENLNGQVGAVQRTGVPLGVIADLRGLTSLDLDFSSMTTVRAQTMSTYENGRRIRYAIYAPGDLAFGMARMYQTMMSDFDPLEIGVFRCLNETADFHGLPPVAREMLHYASTDHGLSA